MTATATATGTLRAAVYLRISDDRLGQEAGVEQQEHVTTQLLEERGWARVLDGDAPCFVDNDISAFDGKERPAYERLLDAVRRGEVDVVVARHPERLHRNMTELDAWIKLTADRDVPVHTIKEGLWNLSTPGGRLVARQLGAVAVYESEHKRERVRDRMKRNAEKGLVHGPLRTYGLQGTRLDNGRHTWKVLDDEAAVIVEAVDRVLSGESILGVVNDFNARGIPSPRGGQWGRQSLRNLILSARICGWREHTVGRKRTDGYAWSGGTMIAQAEWPAIVDKSKVERLRKLLGDPSRKRGSNKSAYLLSNGIALCQCGANLRGRPNNGQRYYYCASEQWSGKGCGKVYIQAEPLEEYVREQVRAALLDETLGDELAALAADTGADVAYETLEELRLSLSELSEDYYTHKAISREEFFKNRDNLTALIASAQRDLDRRQEQESAALLAGGLSAWDARWDAADGDVSKRRALISSALVSVTVRSATQLGRRGFNPERVDAPVFRR